MPTFIRIFFVADVALALVYCFNIIIGEPVSFISRMIDLNREGNLPTWYSSTKLFLIAVLLTTFAYNKKLEKTERGSWILVLAPIVFFLLSLDEIAEIHESLGAKMDALLLPSGGRKYSLFPRTGIWMFYLGPLLLGIMLSIGMSARRYLYGRGYVVRKYVVGMVLFVGSAAGIEIIYNFVSNKGIANVLQIISEESGEMLGATILLWATWELLVSYHFSLGMGK